MVYCLHAATGALVWSYETGGDVYSSPVVNGGHVYVGSDDHKVYCLEAAPGDIGEWPMFRHDPCHTGCLNHFRIDLSDGWNLIGFGDCDCDPVDLALVTISDGRETKWWDEAVSAAWIQEPAFWFVDHLGYRTLGTSPPDWDSTTIDPGLGYWLLNQSGGPLTLNIPR